MPREFAEPFQMAFLSKSVTQALPVIAGKYLVEAVWKTPRSKVPMAWR